MDHTRHQNIYNIPTGFSVAIIGAGGIGAITALTLAKMGVQNMVLFDDDIVGEENIATQLHKVSDVGKLKVEALGFALQEYSDDISLMVSPEWIASWLVSKSGWRYAIPRAAGPIIWTQEWVLWSTSISWC
jgi:hypothetical protein